MYLPSPDIYIVMRFRLSHSPPLALSTHSKLYIGIGSLKSDTPQCLHSGGLHYKIQHIGGWFRKKFSHFPCIVFYNLCSENHVIWVWIASYKRAHCNYTSWESNSWINTQDHFCWFSCQCQKTICIKQRTRLYSCLGIRYRRQFESYSIFISLYKPSWNCTSIGKSIYGDSPKSKVILISTINMSRIITLKINYVPVAVFLCLGRCHKSVGPIYM